MPTYKLHTDKSALETISTVFNKADNMSNTHFYHFSLKTGGRGKDKLQHPENMELLHMASCFTLKELNSLALKGGFNNAQDMLYMATGRPDGMKQRGAGCDNVAQKQKHDLIIKYMRQATGQKAGSVVAYTTKSVTNRPLHDTVDNLQAIALIDWELNKDVILADAYQDAEEFDYDAIHTMALWCNESRKLHPAPTTQPTATDKVA